MVLSVSLVEKAAFFKNHSDPGIIVKLVKVLHGKPGKASEFLTGSNTVTSNKIHRGVINGGLAAGNSGKMILIE